MALRRKPFYYDRQLKRMHVQIMSCFTGYQAVTGNLRDGQHKFLDVPVLFGDYSQAARYIIRDGTDNSMAYLPIIAVYMTGLRQKAAWRQQPQHSERYNFVERAKDPEGNLLINTPGVKKTVERYQPVPYEVDYSVAIWASNNDQGYQLVEQICTQFNPSVDIQLRNRPSDWTFLTRLEFKGDVQMEKAVPDASNMNPLFVFTLPFQTVLWMSLPAKVYETKDIREIHVPIEQLEADLDFDSMPVLDGLVIKATEEELEAHGE